MAMKRAFEAMNHWLRPEHPRARGRRLLAAGLGLALAWALLGGQQGLFALVMSQREKVRLRSEIEELRSGNVDLEKRVAMLQSHPEYYERDAREKLQLMRPGDTIYRFQ
jgi:cell division protein FtsB